MSDHIELDDTEGVEVSDDVTEVEVSATRKVQLDQYEPFSAGVTLKAEAPTEGDSPPFRVWLDALHQKAVEQAEKVALRRHEEYVRQEAFDDE